MVAESPNESLEKLFRQFKIATLAALFVCLKTKARVTVFRHLKASGYLTSFTHGNRYYSLNEIPKFDELGIWFFKGVGFSRNGRLKPTIIHLIENSVAGYSHDELRDILKTKSHNSLLQLASAKEIQRERVEKQFVYLSANENKRNKQLRERARRSSRLFPSDTQAVLIFVELIKDCSADPQTVSSRLLNKGHKVKTAMITNLLEHHGLLKKSPVTR